MAGGVTNPTTGRVALRSYGSISYAGLLSYSYANLKRADGSWVNENNRWWEKDPSLVTTYALMAVEILWWRAQPA